MEGRNYVARNTQKGERFGLEEHIWGGGITNSWPSRNYACSFCKREFKSAQALGGHMNVHRRDRARLRSSFSSSSSLVINSESSPKPKPSNNTTTTQYLSLSSSPYSSLYSPCNLNFSSSSLTTTISGDKKPRLFTSYSSHFPLLSFPQIKSSTRNHDGLGVDEDNNISLELGIGFLSKHHNVDQNNNHLDLELRLGHF